MSGKLIISKPQYSCPVCDTEWYESDLDSIGDLGCPSCRRKFDLEEFLNDEEPLWHDWRSKCYFRMTRQNKIADETESFMRFNDEHKLSETELFNEILNDERQ